MKLEVIIRSISQDQYKPWLLKKHYAKRIPSISYAFGLYDNGVLVGVCTYGKPASNNLCEGVCGKEYSQIVFELNRLCVNDGLPKNSLSYFVGQTLKLLPSPLILVSYADTAQNHNGYIYQATNWIYTGLSAKRTDWKIKGMEEKHGFTISDISRGQENRAEYMREKFGDDFYLRDRSRKHRYIMFIGNKYEKKNFKNLLKYPISEYPKGENKRYDTSVKLDSQMVLL